MLKRPHPALPFSRAGCSAERPRGRLAATEVERARRLGENTTWWRDGREHDGVRVPPEASSSAIARRHAAASSRDIVLLRRSTHRGDWIRAWEPSGSRRRHRPHANHPCESSPRTPNRGERQACWARMSPLSHRDADAASRSRRRRPGASQREPWRHDHSPDSVQPAENPPLVRRYATGSWGPEAAEKVRSGYGHWHQPGW
jgi:hypothetical protein